MNVVTLSVLHTDRLYPPRRYPYYSLLSEAESMTPSGIEPTTFPIVAQCLDQLRHEVPRNVLQIYGRFGGIQYLSLLDLIYTHDKVKLSLSMS